LTEDKTLNRPIGIFDSGIGGLTVLREIASRLPGEDIIYLGDTARVPYGIRSDATVVKYSFQNSEFLMQQGIKALVVACNTVSAVGIEALRGRLSIPVIGVIGPGAKAASRASRRKRIGVVGTEATINSGAYQRMLAEMVPGAEIVARPCPLFVPLVEEGWTSGSITMSVIRKYLGPLKRRRIDVLVLGCTHYPLLKKSMGEYLGEDTVLIDSAVETARETRDILHRERLLVTERRNGRIRYFVTDSPDRFRSVGEMFLGRPIDDITMVDIA